MTHQLLLFYPKADLRPVVKVATAFRELTFWSCSIIDAIWKQQAWTCLSYAAYLFLSNTCPHRPEVGFSVEIYTQRGSVTLAGLFTPLWVYKCVNIRPNGAQEVGEDMRQSQRH